MNNTEELKPCPFCGGAARLDQRVTQSLWNSSDAVFSHVACDECDIHGQDFCDDPDGSEAIEWWNARAQLPSQGGEAVAFIVTDMNGDSYFAYDRQTPSDTPLYTHPADQVAEPDAELVELLRNKFPRIDPCKPVPLDEKAHCCEYTIYVERERLHRLIDAKLASLKP